MKKYKFMLLIAVLILVPHYASWAQNCANASDLTNQNAAIEADVKSSVTQATAAQTVLDSARSTIEASRNEKYQEKLAAQVSLQSQLNAILLAQQQLATLVGESTEGMTSDELSAHINAMNTLVESIGVLQDAIPGLEQDVANKTSLWEAAKSYLSNFVSTVWSPFDSAINGLLGLGDTIIDEAKAKIEKCESLVELINTASQLKAAALQLPSKVSTAVEKFSEKGE